MSTAPIATPQVRPEPASEETIPVAEAARLTGYSAAMLRLLCVEGRLASQEIDGEPHISREDFLALQARERALYNSPAVELFDEINDELLANGLYWSGGPHIKTR